MFGDVSLDMLCRWQVHVSVQCLSVMPYVCFLVYICFEHRSHIQLCMCLLILYLTRHIPLLCATVPAGMHEFFEFSKNSNGQS